MSTATVTFTIPTEIKDACAKILEPYDMTIEEYCSLCLLVAAKTGQLAFAFADDDDDSDLEEVVRERLADNAPGIEVKLEDL